MSPWELRCEESLLYVVRIPFNPHFFSFFLFFVFFFFVTRASTLPPHGCSPLYGRRFMFLGTGQLLNWIEYQKSVLNTCSLCVYMETAIPVPANLLLE